MLLPKLSQSVIAVDRKHWIITCVLQHNLDDAAYTLLVVNNENDSHSPVAALRDTTAQNERVSLVVYGCVRYQKRERARMGRA